MNPFLAAYFEKGKKLEEITVVVLAFPTIQDAIVVVPGGELQTVPVDRLIALPNLAWPVRDSFFSPMPTDYARRAG